MIVDYQFWVLQSHKIAFLLQQCQVQLAGQKSQGGLLLLNKHQPVLCLHVD